MCRTCWPGWPGPRWGWLRRWPGAWRCGGAVPGRSVCWRCVWRGMRSTLRWFRVCRRMRVGSRCMPRACLACGGGRRALDGGGFAAARTALSAVESASRAALTEMRQLLGGLRAGDAGEYGPTPGLADLPSLVEGLRAQGVPVALSVGELGEVP